MALKRFYLRVYGYVQGVGFRHFALRLAKSMGISGWVRNLNDGSVELEAEGPKESIENFVNRVSAFYSKSFRLTVTTVPCTTHSFFLGKQL